MDDGKRVCGGYFQHLHGHSHIRVYSFPVTAGMYEMTAAREPVYYSNSLVSAAVVSGVQEGNYSSKLNIWTDLCDFYALGGLHRGDSRRRKVLRRIYSIKILNYRK